MELDDSASLWRDARHGWSVPMQELHVDNEWANQSSNEAHKGFDKKSSPS